MKKIVLALMIFLVFGFIEKVNADAGDEDQELIKAQREARSASFNTNVQSNGCTNKNGNKKSGCS